MSARTPGSKITNEKIGDFFTGAADPVAVVAHLNQVVAAVNDLKDNAQNAPAANDGGGGELRVWLLVDTGTSVGAQLVTVKGSLVASVATSQGG